MLTKGISYCGFFFCTTDEDLQCYHALRGRTSKRERREEHPGRYQHVPSSIYVAQFRYYNGKTCLFR